MEEYICYLNRDSSISVCRKAFWEKSGHLDDRHDKELNAFMGQLRFTELRTNVYSRPNYYSAEGALHLLEQHGFTIITPDI